jgi:hypothetical protein
MCLTTACEPAYAAMHNVYMRPQTRLLAKHATSNRCGDVAGYCASSDNLKRTIMWPLWRSLTSRSRGTIPAMLYGKLECGHHATDPSSNNHMQFAQNSRSPMRKSSKRGDHVEWNSEAGRVRGAIVKKVVSDVRFKGYVHHAPKDKPQYIMKNEKTEHIAIHKERALKHVRARIQSPSDPAGV